MKRLLSVNYSDAAFNFSMMLLRLSFGVFMIVSHGLPKIIHFAERQNSFYNFAGLGSRISLLLAIFAEVFCSLFVVLGLFTRIAILPLIATMVVVIFLVDKGKAYTQSEMALLFLTAFTVLLFCGPGKVSVDGLINR